MNILMIFICIYGAMVAHAFWEGYVEGRNVGHKGKLGWKIRIGKSFIFTAYHFWLFYIMYPLLLSLPFVIYGWDYILFGVFVSAYFSGLVIEDFLWYLVNPVVKIRRDFNSKFAEWYPWIKIVNIEIPLFYILSLLIAFLSWRFIWGFV